MKPSPYWSLRAIIKSTIPEAEKGISWNVPFYKYGSALTGLAVYKNHVSFGVTEEIQSENRKTLETNGFKTGKKTTRIGLEQKVPEAAIKQVLKTQATKNESRKPSK